MRLAKAFSKGKAFVAYLTVGDPSLAASAEYLRALERAGADIVELGVPFSDPVADGPVNQRAAQRALLNKVSLAQVLQLAARARAEGNQTPFVLFTYLNPILRLGFDDFARRAKASGIDAVLVVDLTLEEADEYRAAMARAELATVFLASPTTAPARAKKLARASTGFLYYVSRTGVTGARDTLSATLAEELHTLREQTGDIPICVGFGVSTPEQVRTVAELAEGVVVGSALGETIERGAGKPETVYELEQQVSRLCAPLRMESAC